MGRGGRSHIARAGRLCLGWLADRRTSARGASDTNANTAVVGVLAPICAVQFRQQIDAAAKLTELKALKSYEQPGFVEKGGWATTAGSEQPLTGVASACSTILTAEA